MNTQFCIIQIFNGNGKTAAVGKAADDCCRC